MKVALIGNIIFQSVLFDNASSNAAGEDAVCIGRRGRRAKYLKAHIAIKSDSLCDSEYLSLTTESLTRDGAYFSYGRRKGTKIPT